MSRNAAIQIRQQSVFQPINPTVNTHALAMRPCRLHDRRPLKPRDLIARAHIAQEMKACRLVSRLRQFILVLLGDVADRLQPVIDDAVTLSIKRGADSAAAIVAANNDVGDFENLDCIFEDGQKIEVAWVHQIGDIAMHEHLSRFQTRNRIGRNSAVRTADPQILRPLEIGQPFKIMRIVVPALLRPPAIIFEQVIEHPITLVSFAVRRFCIGGKQGSAKLQS